MKLNSVITNLRFFFIIIFKVQSVFVMRAECGYSFDFFYGFSEYDKKNYTFTSCLLLHIFLLSTSDSTTNGLQST